MQKIESEMTEQQFFELLCQRIYGASVNIADTYDEYLRFAFVCSMFGEVGRQWFHKICAFDDKYNAAQADLQFNNCQKTSRHEITLGTLVHMAKLHGVDTTKPQEAKPCKGRPRKTDAEREEERKNQFELVSQMLNSAYQFRYNVLSERIEVKPGDEDWRDFDDRELNGILTSLHSSNVKVSKDNLATYIDSSKFSVPYNPVAAYVESLKPWNHRKDYIRQVFDHLHLEDGVDQEFLFECFKLWFTCLVGCGAGLDVTNQLMLVLEGEKEGTGKTEFICRLLPPVLRQYLYTPVQLSSYRDKDESLAMAHNIIFFLDEVQLNRQTFNKLKNMVGGAGANTVTERAPYSHSAKVRNVHASLAATTNHLDFLPEDLGNRRFLVLPIVGSDNYDDMPVDKAFAQAYYLAKHPRKFSTRITPEMVARIKEINRKYVAEDICQAVIPTVLRQPNAGEQAQAVTSGEIISWLTTRTGPNRDYSPQKVNAAMRKLGFVPSKTNKGNIYIVKRIIYEDLKREGEQLAIQKLRQEVESELPF